MRYQRKRFPLGKVNPSKHPLVEWQVCQGHTIRPDRRPTSHTYIFNGVMRHIVILVQMSSIDSGCRSRICAWFGMFLLLVRNSNVNDENKTSYEPIGR